jgi:peptidoglycan/xylan/chitin deacetylase (PgdA/CDA1 family)
VTGPSWVGSREIVLVERDAELAALVSTLDSARAGAGSLLLIEGPAGIGKTALAEAVRMRASQDGIRVLYGRGTEFEREYAFGVVRQCLVPAVRREDERARALRGAAQLAEPVLLGAPEGVEPVEDDPGLQAVLDRWCEAGNHVGNHTHHHASLNWVSADQYIEDIERSEQYLDEWLARAATRYFRFTLDMWGDTADKTDQVVAHLARAGYLPCPVSTWFYDAQFISPYLRALAAGDEEGRRWIQDQVVHAAITQLQGQVAAAPPVHGRAPSHIGRMPIVHPTGFCAWW